MNKFYGSSLSEEIAEREELAKLAEQVQENPWILNRLPLVDLARVNEYLREKRDKLHRQLEALHAEAEAAKARVLLVEPGKSPRPIETDPDHKSLQQRLGGDIKYICLRDGTAVIVRESGRQDGLPLNRVLLNPRGEVCEVLYGPFLIAGMTELAESLSEDQMVKYETLFHQPALAVKAEVRFTTIGPTP